MKIPQKKIREAVFLALFGQDIGASELDALVDMIMQELKMTKKNVYEALSVSSQILQKKDDLDETIRLVSTAYEFERIPFVERNILRLALFEMQTLPGPIAISEAIRLTRKFSTAEAASFINALLDKVLKDGTK